MRQRQFEISGRVGKNYLLFSGFGAARYLTAFFYGYYWCQEFRKTSQVPIIFISSAPDDMNLVMAVNMGADDFLSKTLQAGSGARQNTGSAAQDRYLCNPQGCAPGGET